MENETKNYGGPAFPQQLIDSDRGKFAASDWIPGGMSLWDYYFNGQTAACIIGLMSRRNEAYTDEEMIHEAIRLGKIAADEMIKESSK